MKFLLFKFKLLFWLFDCCLSSVDKSFLPRQFYFDLVDQYDYLYNSVVDIKAYIISKGVSYEKKDASPKGQKDLP